MIPQFIAILNSVKKLEDQVNQIQANTYDLNKIIDVLTLIDPNQLKKGQRNSIQKMSTMTKIAKEIVATLRFIPSEIENRTRFLQLKKFLIDTRRQMDRV